MDSLEPDHAELEIMLRTVVRYVLEEQSARSRRPASMPAAPDYRALLAEPLPEASTPLAQALELVIGPLAEGGVDTVSAGNLSYVNGGGLMLAAVASMVSAATNRYVPYGAAAPGYAELERQVIRWFVELIGLPSSSSGVLLTGSSMAGLTALVAARKAKLGERFLDGVVYLSDQGHHSLHKAALVAGLPEANIREIPTDSRQEIDCRALEQALEDDRRRGLRPFFIAGSAGTTNTGAVDDLSQLADIAERHGMWLHIDAAYGGFFALTERGRVALQGIERGHSVALDPHKSLFLPYGLGCLLVQDVRHLQAAHALQSDYVSSISRQAEENFADLSIEMSRDFRGLRAWLPIKVLGIAAFRRALDEKLDLARYFAEQIEASPHFELLASPKLSIVAFRARSNGGDDDDLNHRVLDHVNRSGRVHLSSTVVRGKVTLRVCILSFRVHRLQVEQCLEDLASAFRASTGHLEE